jgi:hypothetical protein
MKVFGSGSRLPVLADGGEPDAIVVIALVSNIRLPWQQPCQPGRLTPAHGRPRLPAHPPGTARSASAPIPSRPGPARAARPDRRTGPPRQTGLIQAARALGTGRTLSTTVRILAFGSVREEPGADLAARLLSGSRSRHRSGRVRALESYPRWRAYLGAGQRGWRSCLRFGTRTRRRRRRRLCARHTLPAGDRTPG